VWKRQKHLKAGVVSTGRNPALTGDYKLNQKGKRRMKIFQRILLMGITLIGFDTCFAVEFHPGQYQVEFSLPAYEMGQSKQVLDTKCMQVNRIGWNFFNKPQCELLSSTEKGNKLSYDVRCSGEETGNTKLKIEITVDKDSFYGDIWLSEKDKMVVSGKRVASCSPADPNASTSGPEQLVETFQSYVKKRYQIDDTSVTSSDVVQTEDGKSGSFWLSGEIIPHKKPKIDSTTEVSREVRAREVAKAFLEDEQVLFDLKDLSEIKEVNISTDKLPRGEFTHINYKRFVNGIAVDGSHVQIVIGPSENITTVQAHLVAVPAAAYAAAATTTLSEKDIISIVEADHNEQDVKRYPKDQIVKQFKKTVITTEPYVVWDVFYRYIYRVDAFTGKILSKHSAIKY
jgi:hypothetical protein